MSQASTEEGSCTAGPRRATCPHPSGMGHPEVVPTRPTVLAAVAAGGASGALARWGVGVLAPPGPWPTLVINVVGCLLIGVLVGLVPDAPLLRPMLGTGGLGGFTTFSGYALDGTRLLAEGRDAAAALYLGGTLAGAVAATWVGAWVAGGLRRSRM